MIVPSKALVTLTNAILSRAVDVAGLVGTSHVASDIRFAREEFCGPAVGVDAGGMDAIGSLVVGGSRGRGGFPGSASGAVRRPRY